MHSWMRLFWFTVLVFGVLANGLAQTPARDGGPIPSQVLTARKVFISNAGADALADAAFRRLGDPNRPYSRFYSEMKNWGKYELVSAPGDAELVFEIHFGSPISGCDQLTNYAPNFELSILDTRTHFTLWKITAPVDGAIRKATFEKNLDQGMSRLMTELKGLTGQTAAAMAEATH